jgi:hypothetical protein
MDEKVGEPRLNVDFSASRVDCQRRRKVFGLMHQDRIRVPSEPATCCDQDLSLANVLAADQ